MKRIFAAITALALALALTACGGTQQPQQQEIQKQDSFCRSVYNPDSESFANGYTEVYFTIPGDWYLYTDAELVYTCLDNAVTADELAMWSSADFEKQPVVPDFGVCDLATKNAVTVEFINKNLASQSCENDGEWANYAAQDIKTDDDTTSAAVYSFQVTLGTQQFTATRRDVSSEDGPYTVYVAVKSYGDWLMAVTVKDCSGMGIDTYLGYFD